MNKKILAVAVAAAFVAPAAYADATIYGKMHATIDNQDYERTNEDNWEVNSRASRIGIRGSEDLGGGLSAIYQLELGVDINSGGADGQASGSRGPFGSKTRNTFVGLSGDWGTAFVGRHDTPAKVAFYAAGTEVQGDSILDLNLGSNISGSDNPNAPIGVFHEYRADDTIVYVSPDFSGFSFLGAIIPGEDNDDKNSGGRDGIADHYSIGAIYKGGGLKASAGYAKYALEDGNNSKDKDDYTVAQLGASYTFNNFTIGGNYETSEDVPDGFNLDGNDRNGDPLQSRQKGSDYDAWGITGKYAFGNNAVSAVYTSSSYDADNGNDVDGGGWGLGAEHNFSKRTKVYAAYASGTFEYDAKGVSDDDNKAFSLGMIHSF
jgi:predicted porin